MHSTKCYLSKPSTENNVQHIKHTVSKAGLIRNTSQLNTVKSCFIDTIKTERNADIRFNWLLGYAFSFYLI